MEQESGTLLIVTPADDPGHIEFFPTVSYLDELELAYHIYNGEHRGLGATTEAVRLMTRYLFDTKRHNRIRRSFTPTTRPRGASPKCSSPWRAPPAAPGSTGAAS